jgi:single-strand DNA-binding protein
VVNDYYKPKGSDEFKQEATSFECAYWRNAQIAEKLTKGSVVEVTGSLEARGYIDGHNDIKAVITLRAYKIQIFHEAKADQEETEDLPDIAEYHQE